MKFLEEGTERELAPEALLWGVYGTAYTLPDRICGAYRLVNRGYEEGVFGNGAEVTLYYRSAFGSLTDGGTCCPGEAFEVSGGNDPIVCRSRRTGKRSRRTKTANTR